MMRVFIHEGVVHVQGHIVIRGGNAPGLKFLFIELGILIGVVPAEVPLKFLGMDTRGFSETVFPQVLDQASESGTIPQFHVKRDHEVGHDAPDRVTRMGFSAQPKKFIQPKVGTDGKMGVDKGGNRVGVGHHPLITVRVHRGAVDTFVLNTHEPVVTIRRDGTRDGGHGDNLFDVPVTHFIGVLELPIVRLYPPLVNKRRLVGLSHRHELF
jgi:hypothetical protein